MSPEYGILRALGAMIRLSAEAVDANGHVIEGVEFTWSSDDESVATVDDDGLVKAIGNGVATVEASVEGVVGSSEANENWGTDAPIDTWHGVLGDAQLGVLALVLGGNGLTGSIPPETAGLEYLLSMHVIGNSIAGPIPAELGNLQHLGHLNISDNQLTGAIPPELGNLGLLKSLKVNNTALNGRLPLELIGLPLELRCLPGMERIFARPMTKSFRNG